MNRHLNTAVMRTTAVPLLILCALLAACAGQYREQYDKDVSGETDWNRVITERGAIYRTVEQCNAALEQDLAAEQSKRDQGQAYEKLNNARCVQVGEARKKAGTAGAIAGAALCVATGVASGVATGGSVILCP